MSVQNATEIRYGRLTVIGDDSSRRVLCRCDCGTVREFLRYNLRNGNTQSCGCLMRERTSQANSTHGHSRDNKTTRVYEAWCHLLQRCTNPKDRAFADYGGRGITVCSRWSESFENFLADMGEPPPNTSIDRIDNGKGYEPGNCRWATQTQQTRNARSNRLLTCYGKTQCAAAWAEQLGISPPVLYQRLHSGWSDERALMTPVRYSKKRACRA